MLTVCEINSVIVLGAAFYLSRELSRSHLVSHLLFLVNESASAEDRPRVSCAVGVGPIAELATRETPCGPVLEPWDCQRSIKIAPNSLAFLQQLERGPNTRSKATATVPLHSCSLVLLRNCRDSSPLTSLGDVTSCSCRYKSALLSLAA